MERLRLIIFASVFLTLVLSGTLGFMYIEGLSATDAIYFTVVTISTVGYGDLHPVTSAGKFLTMLLIISGGGSFFGILASATELILNRREKHTRIEKLNMIIGVFLSEVGSELLARFTNADPNIGALSGRLDVNPKWTKQDFEKAKKIVRKYKFTIDIHAVNLPETDNFLKDKSNILLRLLENPNILEHESFTMLLRSVFHIKEELSHREDLTKLPQSDYDHLSGDIRRAYALLILEWLDYMKYLKGNYPYLFAFASRTSPFASSSSSQISVSQT